MSAGNKVRKTGGPRALQQLAATQHRSAALFDELICIIDMDAPYRMAVSNHYHDCLYKVTPGQLSSTVIDEFGATIDQFQHPVP